MSNYYDQDGNPIDLITWGKMLQEGGEFERRIGATTLWHGAWVSTVWLGLNHRWGDDGPPLIFETMVFGLGGFRDLDCDRYSTKEQALAGHEVMVRKWRWRAWPVWRSWISAVRESITNAIRKFVNLILGRKKPNGWLNH